MDLDYALVGTYVAFSAGTGIYCFLDFVAYTIRYLAFKAGESLNYNNNKISNEETFSEANSDFKLILFVSYPTKENEVWADILSKANEINKKHNMNIFYYYTRISSVNNKRWDSEYFKSALAEEKSRIQKVFLCGPPGFLDSTKENVINTNLVDPRKIHMV